MPDILYLEYGVWYLVLTEFVTSVAWLESQARLNPGKDLATLPTVSSRAQRQLATEDK